MKIPIFLNFDYNNVIGYAVFKDDLVLMDGDEFSYSYMVQESEGKSDAVLRLQSLSLVPNAATEKYQQEKKMRRKTGDDTTWAI